LKDITRNVNGFIEGNNSGGWDNWLEVTTVPQNNAFGAFVIAQDEISKRIVDLQSVNEKYLDWGRGFKDMQKCVKWENSPNNVATPNTTTATFASASGPASFGSSASVTSQPGSGVIKNTAGQKFLNPSPNSQQKCVAFEKTTPGAMVEERLGQTLGVDLQQLAVADDINAILDALANQVTKQIFTGAKGLLGSGSNSSNKDAYGSIDYTKAIANPEGNDPKLDDALNGSFKNAQEEVAPLFDTPDVIDVSSTTPYSISDDDINAEVPQEQKISWKIVTPPNTVTDTTPLTYRIDFAPNYSVNGLTAKTTLRRSGTRIAFSTVFTYPFVAQTGRTDGTLGTAYPLDNYADMAWKNISATKDAAFSFRFQGSKKVGSAPTGNYTLETVITDSAGNEIAHQADSFIIQ
jgi:hypothetical protein